MVRERLVGAGTEVFFPTVEKLQKWTDRTKAVRFPLFPGYLFVHIDGSQQGRLVVLKTKGVVQFLGSTPGEPEPVPDEQIQTLIKVTESQVQLDPYPYLREGQRVRISRGPLAGIEGLLETKKDRHVLVLSVDILRQSTSLTIDAADVEEL